MIFDKGSEIEIKGKKYLLCYPLKHVWAAERQLSDRNFLVLFSNAAQGIPPSMGDIYVIFKYALLGGNLKMEEDEAEELYLAALEEHPMIELFQAAQQALEKSGVLGKRKKEQAAQA